MQLCRNFVSQSSELCCFSVSVYCYLFCYQLSLETFGYTLVYFIDRFVLVCCPYCIMISPLLSRFNPTSAGGKHHSI